jgi:hypothetical protein
MEIKFIFYIWFLLIVLGLTLILIRKDLESVKREGIFIMQKGRFYHKLLYVLIMCILLPLSIPYSIIKLTKN